MKPLLLLLCLGAASSFPSGEGSPTASNCSAHPLPLEATSATGLLDLRFARADDAQADERVAPASRASAAGADRLAEGTAWKGTWFDEVEATAWVERRADSRKTATIALEAPRGLWHFDVKTNRSGSRLSEVTAIRHVRSVRELDVYTKVKGEGSVKNGKLSLSWRGKSTRDGRTWDSEFRTGKP